MGLFIRSHGAVTGEKGASNPLDPALWHARGGAATHAPQKRIRPFSTSPWCVDGDTTPFAARGSRSEVAVEGGCAQPARISCPSSSTGARTTSGVGAGSSCPGGLRPKWSRMRLIEISSVM